MKYILKKSEYLIKESFFNKGTNTLENLIKSFKSLFLNLKFSIDHEFKIDFFRDNIKTDLSHYRDFLCENYSKTNRTNFEYEFKKLINEIDYDLIEEFELNKFLKNILNIFKEDKNADIAKIKLEKIFNSYIEKIDSLVKTLMMRIKRKIENDEFYDPMGYSVYSSITYDEYMRQKYFLSIELLKLQEWIKEQKKKVLVIFEGRDAAGKGSLIESIKEDLDNKFLRIEFFGIPKNDEKKDWFKRYEKVLPEKGEIVLFDRSWYTRAYVEPAMGYCSDKEYQKFMNEVNEFEEKLEKEKDIILIKIWLSVTKETQSLKFELRKSNPLKYWKYSKNDEESRFKWDKFTEYINKMLKKANKIPWNIVDSNDQRGYKMKAIKRILNKFDYPDKIKYDEKGNKIN